MPTLEAMPPWKGAGRLIDRGVHPFDATLMRRRPAALIAGTPHIVRCGCLLIAAIQYVEASGWD